jgi:hypothetical protein
VEHQARLPVREPRGAREARRPGGLVLVARRSLLAEEGGKRAPTECTVSSTASISFRGLVYSYLYSKRFATAPPHEPEAAEAFSAPRASKVIKTVHNALILLVVALLRGALKQAFAHGVLVSEMGRRGAGWYSAAHWERTV